MPTSRANKKVKQPAQKRKGQARKKLDAPKAKHSKAAPPRPKSKKRPTPKPKRRPAPPPKPRQPKKLPKRFTDVSEPRSRIKELQAQLRAEKAKYQRAIRKLQKEQKKKLESIKREQSKQRRRDQKQLKKQAKRLVDLGRQKAAKEMVRRARQVAKEVIKAQVERAKARVRSAKKALGTKSVRKIREELFGGLTHRGLVRHLRNRTADWKYYEERAKKSAKWDSRRIRDEFFSPKVRGKARGGKR